MSDAPAAYSLYELLRTLVDRVGWPSEDEKRAAHRSISEAERLGILGNLAVDMVCDHPEDQRSAGQCLQCGRQMENTTGADNANRRRFGQPDDYRYQPRSGRGW